MADGRKGRRKVHRPPQTPRSKASSQSRWDYPPGTPAVQRSGYDPRAVRRGEELIRHMQSLPNPVLTLADDVFIEQFVAGMSCYYCALDHYNEEPENTLELARRTRLLMQTSRYVLKLLSECGRTPLARLQPAPAAPVSEDEEDDLDEDELEFRRLSGSSHRDAQRQTEALERRRSARNGSGRRA